MKKTQVWITRDFLFVDLLKKLNSLTSRFRQVSCQYTISIYDETILLIICLTKNGGFYLNSQLLKKMIQKNLRSNRYWWNRNQTKPNRIRPNPCNQTEPKLLLESGHWNLPHKRKTTLHQTIPLVCNVNACNIHTKVLWKCCCS